MCFISDSSKIFSLQPFCFFILFHLDAEVAADACFAQNGNCRKTLFSQRCSSRYVMKSQNSSVIA